MLMPIATRRPQSHAAADVASAKATLMKRGEVMVRCCLSKQARRLTNERRARVEGPGLGKPRLF